MTIRVSVVSKLFVNCLVTREGSGLKIATAIACFKLDRKPAFQGCAIGGLCCKSYNLGGVAPLFISAFADVTKLYHC